MLQLLLGHFCISLFFFVENFLDHLLSLSFILRQSRLGLLFDRIHDFLDRLYRRSCNLFFRFLHHDGLIDVLFELELILLLFLLDLDFLRLALFLLYKEFLYFGAGCLLGILAHLDNL